MPGRLRLHYARLARHATNATPSLPDLQTQSPPLPSAVARLLGSSDAFACFDAQTRKRYMFPRLAAVAMLLMTAAGAAAQTPPDLHQSVDIQIPHSPTAVSVEGHSQWMYEVHLTNFAQAPLRLTRLQVQGANAEVWCDLTGEALGRSVSIVGGAGVKEPLTLEPGRRAVAYLSVRTAPTRQASFMHRVEFVKPDGSGIALQSKPLPLTRTTPARLGPPLQGGPWVAVYAPEMERGHRRVIYAVDGKARIPGRHAIDWMVPRASADAARNPWSDTQGFGAPVLAVADGRVVALQDGVLEPTLGQPRAKIRLAEAPGNFIALDIGNGRYAVYEHLAPGLKATLGQQVKQGQVIAAVGSTGQASRPHLHFHIGDSASPIATEGQPFELSGWRQIGSYPTIDAFDGGASWSPQPALTSTDSLPAPMSVVVFESSQ